MEESSSNDASNASYSGMVGEHYPALAGGSQEQFMSRVFVIDSHKQPLNPVHLGRARWLLKQRKAAVFKRYPFTIILLNVV